jgi:rhamnulokinase
MTVVAAVDCGATSVRVCRVDLDRRPLVPEVVHRVAHAPRSDAAGHLRWDWTLITSAVVEGLERCLAMGPLDSIGVDTWAVDYGLLDDDGALIGDPYSYRDHRTDGYRTLVDEFGAAAMYAINGLQLQPFNTVFQLAVHDRNELARAARLLWLPELIVHHLTGVSMTEASSAGSSGLVDLTTGDWSPQLCAVAGVEPSLLGPIERAGRMVGEWRGVPVCLVGGHDTASAVAGMGPSANGGSVFVASGTWMLVGAERSGPDTSEWARQRNFTNETGALGGIRFLRNVTGFWLLEQCRPHWDDVSVASLVGDAARFDHPSVVDVDDESLRAPDDMLFAFTTLAGLPRTAHPGLVTRSIVESIAAKSALVVDQLAERTMFDDVVLFGGAARIAMLRDRLAALTGRPVRVGAAEAAALGNAIVQGIALGTFDSLEAGRHAIGGDSTP